MVVDVLFWIVVLLVPVHLVLSLLLNLLGVHLLRHIMEVAGVPHEAWFATFDLLSLAMGTHIWRWLLLEESKDALALLLLLDLIHAIEVG